MDGFKIFLLISYIKFVHKVLGRLDWDCKIIQFLYIFMSAPNQWNNNKKNQHNFKRYERALENKRVAATNDRFWGLF